MASYTPNINLKKPTASEMYNILDWNDNSDKIDTAIGNLTSRISYSTITDFDTFIPVGSATRHIYGNSTGGSAANAPISGDNITYRAEAIGTTTYFTQEATIEYATNSGNRGRKFIRQYLGSSFTPWKELVEKDLTKTISSNGGTGSFVMSVYGMAFVKVGGYRGTSSGVAYICRSGTNSFVIKWLVEAPSNISIAMATDDSGTVTVTNNDTASSVNVWTERLSGNLLWN